MGDLVELTTWPEQKYPYYKVTTSALSVELKGWTAVIILTDQANECSKGYKICLGHQNSIQVLGSELINAPAEIAPVLSENEYRGFWVTWFGTALQVGMSGQELPFMTRTFMVHPLEPVDRLALQYVTFSTGNEYYIGDPVSWRFTISPVKISTSVVKPMKGGKAEWIKVDDQLPDNALIGGHCNIQHEHLYIIRADHRGSITPGKFVPSEGVGYIPWGGDANEKEEFEVLCGFNVQWVPTSHNKIPAGAIAGGVSEERDEILYIGRAYHEGHLIPGKVQGSHRVCYIPYGDKEIAKKEYEILVDPELAQRTLPPDNTTVFGGNPYQAQVFRPRI